MSLLSGIRPLIPSPILRHLRILREEKKLRAVERISCSPDKLARLDAIDLAAVFGSPEYAAERETLVARVKPLGITDSAGGVNPGDRRAIYCLIRYLKPQSVLEVGTHIGASTVHIALALQANGSGTLTTVDIADVNDPIAKPWLAFGSTHSPQDLIQRAGCASLVKFVTAPSLDYLRRNVDTFDFIFLDGDHGAAAVYQETAAAMRISRHGYVMLHDYFPEAKPLWSDGSMLPGPFLGVARLQREGVEIGARPLGNLPWSTKLNSNITSLALAGAR